VTFTERKDRYTGEAEGHRIAHDSVEVLARREAARWLLNARPRPSRKDLAAFEEDLIE
jgi:hypothetical protein